MEFFSKQINNEKNNRMIRNNFSYICTTSTSIRVYTRTYALFFLKLERCNDVAARRTYSSANFCMERS